MTLARSLAPDSTLCHVLDYYSYLSSSLVISRAKTVSYPSNLQSPNTGHLWSTLFVLIFVFLKYTIISVIQVGKIYIIIFKLFFNGI